MECSPLVFVFLVCVPLLFHIWKRHEIPGAIPLIIITFSVLVWVSLAYMRVCLYQDDPGDLFVAAEFMGMLALFPAWVAFSLRITGYQHHKLTQFWMGSLGIGLVMVTLVATNESHHWVWYASWRDDRLVTEDGFVFWLFMAYSYFLTMLGIAVILVRYISSIGIYRRQYRLIFIAGLIPLLTNLLYERGLIHIQNINPTPLGVLLGIVLIWWGLLRYRILDLTPVAYSILLESIQDGMMIVDLQERILDRNRAVIRMLNGLDSVPIGHPGRDSLIYWSELRKGCIPDRESLFELGVEQDAHTLIMEVRANPLLDWKGRTNGYLLLFRDITDRRRIEKEREQLVNDLRDALNQVKTLSGLLPICSYCKKIRDESGNWHSIESYLHDHTEAQLSHGFCPECIKKNYPNYF